MIAAVDAGGPAATAGLKPGEQILRIAGSPAGTTDDVAVALAQQKPGTVVPVEVNGPQGTVTVRVKLGQAP
jgi:serine protease Do